MANHTQANVQFVDTTADFPDIRNVRDLKYIGGGGGSPTAVIRSENVSGDSLWEASGSAEVFEQVRIRDGKGIRVEIADGAKVYIYLG